VKTYNKANADVIRAKRKANPKVYNTTQKRKRYAGADRAYFATLLQNRDCSKMDVDV